MTPAAEADKVEVFQGPKVKEYGGANYPTYERASNRVRVLREMGY